MPGTDPYLVTGYACLQYFAEKVTVAIKMFCMMQHDPNATTSHLVSALQVSLFYNHFVFIHFIIIDVGDELEEFLKDMVHPLLCSAAAEQSSTMTCTEKVIVPQALTLAAEWVKSLTEAGRLYQVSVPYF